MMRNYLPNPPAGTQRISVIKWVGRESSASKEIMNERTSLTSSTVVNEVNNENKYTCSFCEKPFKWRSHWKSHERIHTGERPYQCQICGKRFTRSDGLQCHGTIHGTMLDSYSLTYHYQHPSTTYAPPPNMRKFHELTMQLPIPQCRLCYKICYSFAGLMKHMRKHKGGTSYKCEVCNKIFTKKSAFEIHSRVHTGIKPYGCHICSKAFSIHGNLKRHLLIHSGERPYKCSKCSKCFNNPSHLSRHIKANHPDAG